MDVLFYHLEHVPIERVLPDLLEKSLVKGWRAVVETGTKESAERWDEMLWTYSEESFLPHQLASSELEERPDILPIAITSGSENPNQAAIRFYVEGGDLEQVTGYQRLVYLFNGHDQAAVEEARRAWSIISQSGAHVTYWQQNKEGRWEKRAEAEQPPIKD